MPHRVDGSMPMISVVMSTYREVADGKRGVGASSTLARAINSVVKQRYPAWELWVVADCPPEADVRRIRALIESYHDPRIHFHNLPARAGIIGVGAVPKQAGVARSSGDYLAFLDADNEWTPKHLEHAIAAFNKDSRLDMIYCDTIVRLQNHQSNDLLKFFWVPYQVFGAMWGESFTWRKPDWDGESLEKLQHFNFIDASEAVMTKAAYVRAGGVRATPYYDWKLWQQMIAVKCNNFKHIDHIGLYYTTSTLAQHQGYFRLSQLAMLPAYIGSFSANLNQIGNTKKKTLEHYQKLHRHKHS